MLLKHKLISAFIAIALLAGAIEGYHIYGHIKEADEEAVRDAKDIALTIGMFVSREDEKLKIPPAYTNRARLKDYIDDLQDVLKAGIVVVDVNKRILGDVIAKNIGAVFDHDKNDEVGQTIKDGVSRIFIEKSPDYPAGIRQVAVPMKLETGEAVGAVIFEYTSFFNAKAAETKRSAIVIGIESLAVLLLSIIFGYIISEKIVRPVARLKKTACDIAGGNLDISVDVESKDEIGELAKAFNKMAAELRDSRNELFSSMKKLEDVNAELTDFAYIVSHDLKAPLRAITSLSNWLADDYADKFDDAGKVQFKLLVSRARRMHDLIDGILQYSRVGRLMEEKTEVDLNLVVKDAVDLISPPKNIEIRIGEGGRLPTILCEKTKMQQVFQNLISNAVKYMDKSKGIIRIGCASADSGCCTFYVSDNGPGIEEKYFKKIFQLFQTLKPRDEFESTGVGLAVVKKIIEGCGGKIWVESKIGEGTTFWFTAQGNIVRRPEQGVRSQEAAL